MTTPRGARRTPSTDVRSALVDAAVTVLERDGVGGLTVRAVAAEADVAPMGVYNHLDGKNGLLTAVLQRGFEGLRAAVSPPSVTPIGQRLRESGRGYRRFALANPVVYGLMFTAAEKFGDYEQLGPAAAPAFQALADLVAEGQRTGAVRPGAPEAIALQIWSAVHGGMGLELSDRLPPEADRELLYESLLEMVLRGIAPDPG